MSKTVNSILSLRPLLSKETFNILQILGFNYKKAIGEPLTELIKELIISQVPSNSEKDKEYQTLSLQREIEFLKIIQNAEAYQRFLHLNEKDV